MSTTIDVYKTVGLHEAGTKYYRAYLVGIQKSTKYAPARKHYVTVCNWGADTGGSAHAEERDHGQSGVYDGKSKYGTMIGGKRKRGYTFNEEQSLISEAAADTEESAIGILVKAFTPKTIAEISRLVGGFIGNGSEFQGNRLEVVALDEHGLASLIEAQRATEESEKKAAAQLHERRMQNPLWGTW